MDLKKLHLLAQVDFNLADGLVDALFGRDKQVGRENLVGVEGSRTASRGRVNGAYRLDLFAPELDAHDGIVVGQVDVDRVALHPEIAPVELHLVARVERVDQNAANSRLRPMLSPTFTSMTLLWKSSGLPMP